MVSRNRNKGHPKEWGDREEWELAVKIFNRKFGDAFKEYRRVMTEKPRGERTYEALKSSVTPSLKKEVREGMECEIHLRRWARHLGVPEAEVDSKVDGVQ